MKTCKQHHDNAVVTYLGDSCPICAELENLEDIVQVAKNLVKDILRLREDIEDVAADLENFVLERHKK